MNIGGVTSALSMQKDLASSNATANTGEDFKNTLDQALSSSDDKQLKTACDELESYMLSMVFKQVKQSMLSSDEENALIPKGDYLEMFGETMIDTLAQEVTKSGGVGLSDVLYKQMKKTYAAQMQQSGLVENTQASQTKIDDEV